LKAWFARVNGYDARACDELDVSAPELAWGMRALSLAESLQQHESIAGTAEDPDYWPRGFLPILADGGGSYVVINCQAASPTCGAVYDMGDGDGCCRIASSLPEFIAAATQEIQRGLRRCNPDGSTSTSREYLDDVAPLYGESPFFVRTKVDGPVVDWRPGASPPLARKRGRRIPPATPPNENSVRWAEAAGVSPPTDMGHYVVRLSTAPVEHWYFQQSRLKPETTNIEAVIRHDTWAVKLTRQDRLYFANWNNGKPVTVDSEQMKYNRLTRWPALDKIENFPLLVQQLETVLGIRFIPYANFSFPESEGRGILANPRLIAWLAPCATEVGCYIGSGNSPRK
jgi:hypothetical protein